MAKYLVQIVMAGAQVVGRAFANALKQELSASQAAASRAGGGQKGTEHASTNLRLGMSLEEAKQILNLNEVEKEQVAKSFDHLFAVNNKDKGGSFYLQSKKSFGWLSQKMPMSLSRRGLLQSRYLSTSIDPNIFSSEHKKIVQERLKKSPVFLSGRESTTRAMRSAAVLVPLCLRDGVPSILFTVRSSKLVNYKRDVCFPGGMQEEKDNSIVDTALREAEEELGIRKEQVEIWGSINPVPSRNYETGVTPVLAFVKIDSIDELIIDKGEVECMFTSSLDSLCDSQNWRYTQFSKGYSLPVFVGSEYKIWGLTAIILHIILKQILPDQYKFVLSPIRR